MKISEHTLVTDLNLRFWPAILEQIFNLPPSNLGWQPVALPQQVRDLAEISGLAPQLVIQRLQWLVREEATILWQGNRILGQNAPEPGVVYLGVEKRGARFSTELHPWIEDFYKVPFYNLIERLRAASAVIICSSDPAVAYGCAMSLRDMGFSNVFASEEVFFQTVATVCSEFTVF
jgi:hypothetical protein